MKKNKGKKKRLTCWLGGPVDQVRGALAVAHETMTAWAEPSRRAAQTSDPAAAPSLSLSEPLTGGT
jgi:hypothetical protein